jgi:hypothetical protein
VAIVIGATFANVSAAAAKPVVELHDGTNYTAIIKSPSVQAGETLAPIGEANKIIIPAGGGVFLTSDTLGSIDAIVSILEITA